MMKRTTFSTLLRACLLLVTLLYIGNGAGAQTHYSFTAYNTDWGFVQKEVMQIMQDKGGEMWFATWDGLYRYDGSRFSNYKARPGDGVRMESNRLETICADGSNIWMRGYNGSVTRFDTRMNSIDNLPGQPLIATSIQPISSGGIWITADDGRIYRAWAGKSDNKIRLQMCFKGRKGGQRHLIADHRGNQWIFADGALWRYDAAKGCFVVARKPFRGVSLYENGGSLYFACQGGVVMQLTGKRWIAHKLPTPTTVSQLTRLPQGCWFAATMGDGAYVLRADMSVLKHLIMPQAVPGTGSIASFRQDSHGDIWFCSGLPGVSHYDARLGTLEFLPMQGQFSNDPTLWRRDIKIVENSQGTLWLSPSGNGLARYDRATRSLIPFFDANRQAVWTTENTVSDMFMDHQGNLWYSGKYTGLEKATPMTEQFFTLQYTTNSESGKDVRGLFQDSKGRVWIGAKNGVVSVFDSRMRYLGDLTSQGSIVPHSQQPIGHAYAFAEDTHGVIWMGTKFKGLYSLTPTAAGTFSVRHYEADGSRYALPHNDIFCLTTDHHGRLWIATYGGGLCYTLLGDPSHRFIHAGNLLRQYQTDRFAKVRCVTADGKGTIWVGTTSGMLSFSERFSDPRNVRFTSYRRVPEDASSLSNNDVLDIRVARNGTMYVCTYGGGFCQAVRSADGKVLFRPFTMADGLRSDIVFSSQEDRSGNLWLATENGLVKFYPRNHQLETYSSSFFGKTVDINEGQALHLADGRLMFPSRNWGAIYFSPQQVRVSRFKPRIVFDSFMQNQQTIQPSAQKDAILTADINSMSSITLSHNRNSFSIGFAALDYRDPKNISYAYKLEGFDRQWVLAGNAHEAVYSNLPPGHYIFKVRSTNSDGVWTDNTRSIEVTVKPSFWQTGWAWLLYFLLLVGVVAVSTYILFTILRLKQKVHIEQQIADMKMRFFTNISHEIRTPLTLISGSVKEILRRDSLNKQQRQQLGVVDINANRLVRLVNQMLDLRKAESGKMRLKLQRTEMAQFLRGVMVNFDDLATRQHIAFSLEEPEQDVVIWIDREKMDKVIFNLLSNAFRFTQRGKRVTVSLQGRGDHARVTVSDEGSGISAERQKNIFQLFSSSEGSGAMEQQHTGIGLALTKDLVELHGGTISVRSTVGVGSSFSVDLPVNAPGTDRKADYIADDEQLNNTPQEPLPQSEQVCDEAGQACDAEPDGRQQVLVVDDNADMRNFIKVLLQENYAVTTARNGEEGMKKALETQPDIIIADYMMPVMDGITMAGKLRNDVQTSHIPIIMLSARTDDESKIMGLDTGVDAYIDKPFSADVLRSRVSNLIRQRQLLQQRNVNHYIQKQAMPAMEGNERDKQFMERLTQYIEQHLTEGNLSVDALAREMGMSRSVYFKKVKALTGLGPVDYLRGLRMQRAAALIDSGQYSMAEITTLIGMNDAHYFSKCFKQQYGMTPSAWKVRQR